MLKNFLSLLTVVFLVSTAVFAEDADVIPTAPENADTNAATEKPAMEQAKPTQELKTKREPARKKHHKRKHRKHRRHH